jgi:hypothetical protein
MKTEGSDRVLEMPEAVKTALAERRTAQDTEEVLADGGAEEAIYSTETAGGSTAVQSVESTQLTPANEPERDVVGTAI